MDAIAEFLPHSIAVYRWAGQDQWGDDSYEATPIPVSCLIEGRQQLVRLVNGEEGMSSSVIYCYSPALAISPRDRIVLPDGTSPPVLNVATAHDESGRGMAVTIYLG